MNDIEIMVEALEDLQIHLNDKLAEAWDIGRLSGLREAGIPVSDPRTSYTNPYRPVTEEGDEV